MDDLFKKISENKLREKRAYESPEIKVLYVELEHSIAAGSAEVSPQNSTGTLVLEQWEVGVDDDERPPLEW